MVGAKLAFARRVLVVGRTRDGTGSTFTEATDRLTIAAIGCELVLAAVYRDPLGSA